MTIKLSKYNQQTVKAIEWKTLQEPLLKAWTIRALPHDKAFIYKMFYLAIGALTLWASIMFLIGLKAASNISSTFLIPLGVISCFYFPLLALIYQGILGGKLYSYRLTEKHIEVVCWKDYYHKIKQGLSIFFIVVAVLLFIAFLIKPETILISLGGAIGVGLMAGGTFYSDSFAKRETAYKHYTWQWRDFEPKRLIIDRERSIVCLDAEQTEDLTAKRKKWALFIFCYPNELDHVANIVGQQYPHLKQQEGASRINSNFAL
ncbi:hypothetical protein [Entomomonas asaccharolytica]|uniref:Uncharacterized protein n=1 Tax=Entomomonas asaccharolytica TaxID=2785331 RepID=A0A974RWS0_9GAMM|nr:hypothetical protein [Entomomonas asaccharolytica]QQP85460.1 hypothetical protein JHT90_13970 [Entomomonas asaccharolytica]